MRREARALSLQEALGFQPKNNGDAKGSVSLVTVDVDRLRSIMSHWLGRSLNERPALLGLGVVPGGERRLRLFLDLGGESPVFCLETDASARGEVLPDFRSVWPYCGWWQEELAVFHGLVFGGDSAGRVTWRLA